MSKSNSYSRIVKSSSLIGGAQGISMLIGMVRVKLVAVLLGTAGLGLLDMFRSIQAMASTLSGLGINSSGVREVAEAYGSNDNERISRTVVSLRRICWITGSIGAMALIALCRPLSILTFKSSEYALEIAFLSLVVLMWSVSGGQMALIQGSRRIGDLARVNVISSVTGTIFAVGFYLLLGVSGIVPALLTIALMQLIFSTIFSRRITIDHTELGWWDSITMAGSLVTLGLAFMWTGLLGAVTGYLVRYIVINQIGLAAVGVYAAAFQLSGMLMNFVLHAMGADFYPGLTAVHHNDEKMTDLVNQQTEIGMLLAIPGLLATYTFAPLLIKVFYSPEFTDAAGLLRWFTLAGIGKVLSWPMGYVFLAKGKGFVYAALATGFELFHVVATWFCIKYMNIDGVAVAYFLMVILVVFVTYVMCSRLIGFKWSRDVVIISVNMLFGFALVAVSGFINDFILMYLARMVVILLMTIYCLRKIISLLGTEHKITKILGSLPMFSSWLVVKQKNR